MAGEEARGGEDAAPRRGRFGRGGLVTSGVAPWQGRGSLSAEPLPCLSNHPARSGDNTPCRVPSTRICSNRTRCPPSSSNPIEAEPLEPTWRREAPLEKEGIDASGSSSPPFFAVFSSLTAEAVI